MGITGCFKVLAAFVKKWAYVIFLLPVIYSGNVFGQEFKRNSLAAGVNMSYYSQDKIGLRLNLEYGYSFNDKYSVCLDIGTDSVVIPYIDIGGRWFPWSKTFFAGAGVGIWGLHPEYPAAFSVSPNIGWKINIGENKNWFITPSLAARVIFFVEDDLLSFIYHVPHKAGVQIGYNIK